SLLVASCQTIGQATGRVSKPRGWVPADWNPQITAWSRAHWKSGALADCYQHTTGLSPASPTALWAAVQELRRYDPRGRLRKNRLFDPFSGRFTPIRPTNQRLERKGHPVSGTRETWLAPHVHLATILPPHAPRLTPHQRGQFVRGPTP